MAIRPGRHGESPTDAKLSKGEICVVLGDRGRGLTRDAPKVVLSALRVAYIYRFGRSPVLRDNQDENSATYVERPRGQVFF